MGQDNKIFILLETALINKGIISNSNSLIIRLRNYFGYFVHSIYCFVMW